jgi:hypothetical protein
MRPAISKESERNSTFSREKPPQRGRSSTEHTSPDLARRMPRLDSCPMLMNRLRYHVCRAFKPAYYPITYAARGHKGVSRRHTRSTLFMASGWPPDKGRVRLCTASHAEVHPAPGDQLQAQRALGMKTPEGLAYRGALLWLRQEFHIDSRAGSPLRSGPPAPRLASGATNAVPRMHRRRL